MIPIAETGRAALPESRVPLREKSFAILTSSGRTYWTDINGRYGTQKDLKSLWEMKLWSLHMTYVNHIRD
jgi:hypothetical protein